MSDSICMSLDLNGMIVEDTVESVNIDQTQSYSDDLSKVSSDEEEGNSEEKNSDETQKVDENNVMFDEEDDYSEYENDEGENNENDDDDDIVLNVPSTNTTIPKKSVFDDLDNLLDDEETREQEQYTSVDKSIIQLEQKKLLDEVNKMTKKDPVPVKKAEGTAKVKKISKKEVNHIYAQDLREREMILPIKKPTFKNNVDILNRIKQKKNIISTKKLYNTPKLSSDLIIDNSSKDRIGLLYLDKTDEKKKNLLEHDLLKENNEIEDDSSDDDEDEEFELVIVKNVDKTEKQALKEVGDLFGLLDNTKDYSSIETGEIVTDEIQEVQNQENENINNKGAINQEETKDVVASNPQTENTLNLESEEQPQTGLSEIHSTEEFNKPKDITIVSNSIDVDKASIEIRDSKQKDDNAFLDDECDHLENEEDKSVQENKELNEKEDENVIDMIADDNEENDMNHNDYVSINETLDNKSGSSSERIRVSKLEKRIYPSGEYSKRLRSNRTKLSISETIENARYNQTEYSDESDDEDLCEIAKNDELAEERRNKLKEQKKGTTSSTGIPKFSLKNVLSGEASAEVLSLLNYNTEEQPFLLNETSQNDSFENMSLNLNEEDNEMKPSKSHNVESEEDRENELDVEDDEFDQEEQEEDDREDAYDKENQSVDTNKKKKKLKRSEKSSIAAPIGQKEKGNANNELMEQSWNQLLKQHENSVKYQTKKKKSFLLGKSSIDMASKFAQSYMRKNKVHMKNIVPSSRSFPESTKQTSKNVSSKKRLLSNMNSNTSSSSQPVKKRKRIV